MTTLEQDQSPETCWCQETRSAKVWYWAGETVKYLLGVALTLVFSALLALVIGYGIFWYIFRP